MRGHGFEYRRNIDKLGKPIDRDEWEMTPQTVNAYYDPIMNEIVFPAAMLQPPFFDATADDAVNYGAIGGVIGHEISHGFDDQGSQFDADGNLRDWFTPGITQSSRHKTKALVAQYARLRAGARVPRQRRADPGREHRRQLRPRDRLQGLRALAGGGKPPVIDGLSGEQRLFYGWVQVWRGKVRENEAIVRIKSDPHSPPSVRGTVPLMNQAAFDEAFGVKPGDKMYLAPGQRVAIW